MWYQRRYNGYCCGSKLIVKSDKLQLRIYFDFRLLSLLFFGLWHRSNRLFVCIRTGHEHDDHDSDADHSDPQHGDKTDDEKNKG